MPTREGGGDTDPCCEVGDTLSAADDVLRLEDGETTSLTVGEASRLSILPAVITAASHTDHDPLTLQRPGGVSGNNQRLRLGAWSLSERSRCHWGHMRSFKSALLLVEGTIYQSDLVMMQGNPTLMLLVKTEIASSPHLYIPTNHSTRGNFSSSVIGG